MSDTLYTLAHHIATGWIIMCTQIISIIFSILIYWRETHEYMGNALHVDIKSMITLNTLWQDSLE